MQSDTVKSLTVKTPSLFGLQQKNTTGQLDNIFQSVKKQIDQWGENAKWKIDLVLLDNPQQQVQQNNSTLHPLLSPQYLHPNAITAPSNTSGQNTIVDHPLPITSSTQYPWDYVVPSTINNQIYDAVDVQRKLRESIERQKYLESIVWSQAEQIRFAGTVHPEYEHAINTMKSIFLMTQNEQKVQYSVETASLKKDIDILSKKLKNMAHTLQKIENTELSKQDSFASTETLLTEKHLLVRKLYLSDLRLEARDAEIQHLHELIRLLQHKNETTTASSPKPSSLLHHKKARKGPPYLFQQQYSPRSSQVRTSDPHHPLSGLDSLGIVADQMLSDPEFDSHPSNSAAYSSEKRLRTRLNDRRSQRSIDSAATLLAMPQLMQYKTIMEEQPLTEDTNTTASLSSPEQSKYEHIPKKPRSTYTRWTEAEDTLLRNAVKKYGHSNWEACSKDVTGRSNIQCRNRWIRHLEHKILDQEKQEEEEERQQQLQLQQQQKKMKQNNIGGARHSPSIASLLNSNDNDDHEEFGYGGEGYPHPPLNYRPPSPMQTPKNGKRRTHDEPGSSSSQKSW